MFYPQMLCVRNLELKVKLRNSFSEVLEFLVTPVTPCKLVSPSICCSFTCSQLFTLPSFLPFWIFLILYCYRLSPTTCRKYLHTYTHSPPTSELLSYSVSLPYNLFSTSAFNIYQTFSVCVM